MSKKQASGITTVRLCPFCKDPRVGAIALNFDVLLGLGGCSNYECRRIRLDRRPVESRQAVIFAPDRAARIPCPHLIVGYFSSSFVERHCQAPNTVRCPSFSWLRELGPAFGPGGEFLFQFFGDAVGSRRSPRIVVSTHHRTPAGFHAFEEFLVRPSVNRRDASFRFSVSIHATYAEDVPKFLGEIANSPRFKRWITRNAQDCIDQFGDVLAKEISETGEAIRAPGPNQSAGG